MLELFAVHKVYTEEQLADASDALCAVVGGSDKLRMIAKNRILSRPKADPQVAELAEKNAKQEQVIQEMQKQIAALANQSVIAPPKRLGRPPKEIQE